jgi:hypothetical protein
MMIDKRLLEITDQAIDEFTNDDGAVDIIALLDDVSEKAAEMGLDVSRAQIHEAFGIMKSRKSPPLDWPTT